MPIPWLRPTERRIYRHARFPSFHCGVVHSSGNNLRRTKVLVVGPVGAGKTTAIQSLTDNNSLMTDVGVSDSALLRKQTTTVAMDHGVVRLGEDQIVHVYGAPGQERFDFMWEVLSVGVDGVLLLLDNKRNFPRQDLKNFLSAFGDLIAPTRLIVGVTRSDLSAEPPLNFYARWLGELGVNAEVAFIDPRCKDDVEFLLSRLLEQPAGHAARPIPSRKAALAGNAAAQVHDAMLQDCDFDLTAYQAVSAINGVTGASLTNESGVVTHTSIEDQAYNDYIAFLHGLAPTLDAISSLGRMRRISFKSPVDESLTVFFGPNTTLGMRTERAQSIPRHVDQVKELMQWIKR